MDADQTLEEMQMIENPEKLLEFDSVGEYVLQGGGHVYLIPNPISCYGFKWIIGREVVVDGHKIKVYAVETSTNPLVKQKNTTIGLLHYGDVK